MTTGSTATRRPPVRMIDIEADRIADLAVGIAQRLPQVSRLLLEETSRAELHSAANIPPDVVVMNAVVEFVDEANGQSRTVRLVYPCDADIDAGRISILTPVGAGLIGLRQGQSISWPDREGNERRLSIVRVTPPASTG